MTEPHAGSDVQAIRTRATRDGDDYVISGQKMWATNALRAGAIMLLTVTDPDADERHAGMTAFVVVKEPGVEQLLIVAVARPQHHAMLAERNRLAIAVGRDVTDREQLHRALMRKGGCERTVECR